MSPTRGQRIGQGRTAEVFAWGGCQVLKLFRPGFPREPVDEEFAAAQWASGAGLPAPAVGGMVEVDGRPGILYEHVTGPSLLAVLIARPWNVRHYARLLAELQVRINSVAGAGLPPLRERLRHMIEHAEGLPADRRGQALAALADLPDGDAVLHGDFHPDNVILSPRGPVVLDWMTATAGHPLADVAWTSLTLTQAAIPPEMPRQRLIQAMRAYLHRVYLERYRSLAPFSVADLEAWLLPVTAARLEGNIPAEREPLLALVDQLIAARG